MLGVVGKADGVGAAGDGLRLVEGGVGNRETVARRQIAVRVIGEC
jgi:hypothetical protein